MPEDISLYVTVDQNLRVVDQPAVVFGDFEVKHPGVVVYNQESCAEALAQLYVDLLCGRPLPLHFIARELKLPSLVAMLLFLDRKLTLDPKIPGLMSAVSLVYNLAEPGLAHIDRDLARLFVFLDSYLLSEKSPTKQKMAHRLSQALDWLGAWIREGRLPTMSKEPDPPQVLDRGTNGFVVAQTTPKHLVQGMIELYRLGYLRGVLYAPEREVTHVLAFRKSPYLQFDLEKARGQLNAAEDLLGVQESWECRRLLLVSPGRGTQIPRDTLTQVFIRV